MSSEELKPCPFCGSSELLGFETSHEGGWTIVKCRKCGCSGSTGRSTSEQEATAFWNRRATHPAPAEQVEVVAWQDAENPLYTTAERRVMHEWAGNQYPIVELMTVAQHERILAAQQRTQASGVPDGYALVPFHPTPEMVRAAEEAHMPFGDMDIALRMAILAAAPAQPAAHDQGEVQRLREALELMIDTHDEGGWPTASITIARAALAASTGQEAADHEQ